MILFEKLLANVAKKPKFVHFEDPEVKRICVENWDKDGDGELSIEEAAAVSTIDYIFIGKDSIKNLDLSFLHHWERIDFTNVRNCKRLKRVVYPSSLKEVSGGLIMNCHAVEEIVILSKDIRFTFGMAINSLSSLKRVILYAETPPVSTDPSSYFLWYVNKNAVIYVPDGSVELYKQIPFYAKFAKKILPMSEYHE